MPKLGQLEAVVMNKLWGYDSPAAVRDVLEDVQRERSIAYTTVMTVMDNLYQKGMLTREMEGRAYRYSPSRSREQHTADLMGEVLADSDDRASTLLHFLKGMPPEEIQKLRDALQERPEQVDRQP